MWLKEIFTGLWNSRTNAYDPHNLAYSAMVQETNHCLNDLRSRLKTTEEKMERVEQKSDAEPLPEADADGYVDWQVKDTPYWIRGNNEEGYFITIGKKRVLDGGKDIAEMLKAIKERDYTLLVNTMVVIIDDYADVKSARLRAEQEDTRAAVDKHNKEELLKAMGADPDLSFDKQQ